jgi:hypothetical protein
VWIEQKLLNKQPGSYDALWRARISNASTHRPGYDQLPNQAIVNIDKERKLRLSIGISQCSKIVSILRSSEAQSFSSSEL